MVDLKGESSNHPSAFGEQLKRAREETGVLLEDIVAETKVSRTILEAMEEGRFDRLPERVFSRSFVAQYASTVGLDQEPLLKEFDRAWQEYSEASGTFPNLVAVTEDLGPSIHWRFWLPIAAGVLILLVAAVVILRGSTSLGDELAPDPRRSGARQVSVFQSNEPLVRPTPRQRPVELRADENAESTVEMTVSVNLGEECWIHFRDRDGKTGQHLLADGQTLNLELAGPIKLTIGNAGAVSISIGGETTGDLGLPGEVVHTLVSRDGLQRLGSAGSGAS